MTFSNYEVSSYATTGIIYGSYANPNYGMNVNDFAMYFNTQKQTIDLSIDFAYNSIGNYTLLMTLPYRIESFQNLGNGTLYLRSNSSGSVVMFTYNIKEISGAGPYTFKRAEALLYVNGSILDKVFDLCTLNLPFGGSITNEVSQELENLSTISHFTLSGEGINGTVSVSVPYSASITTTQQIEERFPESDFQVLTFSINEFKLFQFQYVDSAQRMNFENNLLISGVTLGIAGAGFADVLIEVITAKYRKTIVD
jgi:hypothetical protein